MDPRKISAEKIRERLRIEAGKRSPESEKERNLFFRLARRIHRFLKRSRLYRRIYESHLKNLKDLLIPASGISLSNLLDYEGREFVKNAYLTILKREPDPGGERFYVSKLERGELSKIEFLYALRYSEEGKRKDVPVRNLYLYYLIYRTLRIPVIREIYGLMSLLLFTPSIKRDIGALRFYLSRRIEDQETLLNQALQSIKSELRSINESFMRISERRLVINVPDDFYSQLEEKFRGSEDEIKERLRIYLPIIEKIRSGDSSPKALDLGCGRGEWLEILKENYIEASGIDINSKAVEICKRKGLDVKKIDALSFLSNLQDSSLDLVSAFHLFEHLPFETISLLFDEIKRVLKEGGFFIMETPNPTNILVSSYDFFLDPTHIRPLHPYLIKLFASYKGFSEAEVYFITMEGESYVLKKAEEWPLRSIDDYIRASRDFCLIARK